jgi:hypothetical protein
MRFTIRRTFLCALLFAACDTADPGSEATESGLVGDWQASLTRSGGSGAPIYARYTLEMGSDKKTVFEMFLNGYYAMGFEGGWDLKGDKVELTAIRCYKGDTTGVQTLDECGDDMAIPTRDVRWDGRNITIPADAGTLVFQKVVSAMAAKAE